MNAYRHVFGPVRSGRLGLSLGLDCLGARICSFNCVYCEVGATERLTCARRPYVPAEAILAELAAWKRDHGAALDHVTLGGQGEPCLNSDLAAIIRGAKEILPGVPVAVLTNSTPLADATARRDLAEADVVLPSLDSLVDEEYRRVNRPHPSVSLDSLPRAILDFRAEFSGRLWLEVLLCAGLNDSAENLERLRDFRRRLGPDRADVVTLSRPGASSLARPVSREVLAAWKRALDDAPTGPDATRAEQAGRTSPPPTDRTPSPPAELSSAPLPPASSVGSTRAAARARETAEPSLPHASSGGPGAPASAASEPAVDVSAAHSRTFTSIDEADLDERIINSLKRRPQTSIQLASALGAPLEAARAALDRLAAAGRVETSHVDDEAFFAFRGEKP